MNTLDFILEKVGVCENKAIGFRTLFHRGKVKLSRRIRVWPVPGDDRFMEMDPADFSDKYKIIEYYTPKTDDVAGVVRPINSFHKETTMKNEIEEKIELLSPEEAALPILRVTEPMSRFSAS